MEKIIKLEALLQTDREAFIKRNQAAFKKGAVLEFGEQDKEIIPRVDILKSLDAPTAQSFNILCNDNVVGGVCVQINHKTLYNSLDLLFLDADCHSQGIGYKVWEMIEKNYPETVTWETHTPYFEKRNINFYVNKCGFHIVEFFNPSHLASHVVDTPGGEFFFRFEKKMK